MEPKLPAPNFGHERTPLGYGQSVERAPAPSTPEVQSEQQERFEQRGEVTQQMPAQPILPPPVFTAPSVPQPTATPQQLTANDDLPLVANDDDLIEKEWVDKAKKIIVETKDDPYRREQEVGRLQADYLRKRYGRELGASQQ
jgi:hypothetical protein